MEEWKNGRTEWILRPCYENPLFTNELQIRLNRKSKHLNMGLSCGNTSKIDIFLNYYALVNVKNEFRIINKQ